MKLNDKTYLRFEDSIVRRAEYLDNKHEAGGSSMIHGVNKIYNSPVSLSKRISYQSAIHTSAGRTKPNADLSSFSVGRNDTHSLRFSPFPETITKTSTLFYKCLKGDYALDAENYLYLGSLPTEGVLHQGITLDESGNLCLIKGKSKGAIKYIWKKLRGTEKFYCAPIILGGLPQLKFERLFINDRGQLLAKVKGFEQYYEISLSTKMIIKHFDIDEANDMSSSINICLRETVLTTERPDALHFILDDKRAVVLVFHAGSLYLKQSGIKLDGADHQITLKRLTLPLPADCRVVAASRLFNVIKLVTIRGYKKRLFYFNPRHIDIHRYRVRHLSHKPPQGFLSAMGGDPHEKVSSGLPFDSGRLGNFSSRHLPLLSVPVDSFRQKNKAAKQLYHAGDTRHAALTWLQGVDPGFHCLLQTVKRAVKKPPFPLIRDLSRRFEEEMEEIGRVGLSYGMDRVVNSATHYLNARVHIADKVRHVITLLEPKDSISLSDIFEASFFFGIAVAGIPFMPGWFSGILYRLQKGATLSFTKLENGNIKLSYEIAHNKSWIGLLGTGQGLEDHCKLVTVNDIDLGTVLPIEMNIILVHKLDLHRNFSFDFAFEHLDDFLGCLFFSRPEALVALKQHASNISLKLNTKKNSALLIEGKSELRAQVGLMANPSTFLVVPRSALGVGGALSFFNINKQKEETVANQQKESHQETNTQNEHYLDLSLFAFREMKIMPIPMSRVPYISDNLFCFPMPLLEESNQKLPVTRHPLARHFRIDGATMRLNITPMISNSENGVKPKQKMMSPDAINTLDINMRAPISLLRDKVPEDIHLMIRSIRDGIINALNHNYGYQELKSGKNIGTFILSKGDYKTNLSLLAQRLTPEVGSERTNAALSWSRRIKRSLALWTKNTTLGEFLAQRDRALAGNNTVSRKTDYTPYEFIQALERYAARSGRNSLGKEYKVVAVATYKIQAEVLQRIQTEFVAALNNMLIDIEANDGISRHLAIFRRLEAVFNVAKPRDNPFMQLDTIALFKKSTLTRRKGTFPFIIMNIARKRGLAHSAYLDTIKLEYRGRELFPYRLSSTLHIMPDLQ